eukprot:TRINITY_DN15882_c0_g1_i1.p1 TRINITY_DN15882_c0_g1~~TRINITY_DN15882_c0_g1_i1.p1  ORF type:complete len:227 (-),score=38.36 TRINITY_DN15882_c0_g1_i1:91-771(-)
MDGVFVCYCLSDTHGTLPTSIATGLPDLSGVDLILHAGDITQQGSLDHVTQFGDWLKDCCDSVGVGVGESESGWEVVGEHWPAQVRCVVVDGNHEQLHPLRQRAVLAQCTTEERKSLRIDLASRLSATATVLRDSVVDVRCRTNPSSTRALRVCGLAWHGFADTLDESHWMSFLPAAENADVILVHQPPLVVARQQQDQQQPVSTSGYSSGLTKLIEAVRPIAVVC